MNNINKTYSFSLAHDDRFFILSKEAGEVYSQSLNEFWRVYAEDGTWLSKFDLQKHMKDKLERKLLHSDSFLAAMQQVHANLASWKEAKKVCPETKAPHKTKFLQPIRFKQSQIRYEKGFIKLSLGKNKKGEKDYFLFKWNKILPAPTYVTISYDWSKGWKLNAVIEQSIQSVSLNPKNVLSIDLGVKRVATLFDGSSTITISGKKLKALVHYQNKTRADLQTKLSKKKNNSKRSKKIKSAWRRKNSRLQNIKQDILHKASTFIVDYAVKNNISNIIIGDNSSTHYLGNKDKINNQQITQHPEQRIKNYVKEKFESISGQAHIVPEPYTSRTCPCCGHIKKSSVKGRIYKCKECKFEFDRDGVGAINIYNINIKKVSLGREISTERIRLLTRPIGLKFSDSNQLLLAINSEKPYIEAA